MYEAEATVIIVSVSAGLGLFVGTLSQATYGWGTTFLCIGMLTLFYTLLKKALGRS